MKHSECNREIKETENMKERLREVNDRVRRSTSVLLGFHRKNKRNSNETIFEMITAKNCAKLTKRYRYSCGKANES